MAHYYIIKLAKAAEAGLETTRLTEKNYPESIRRAFLINGTDNLLLSVESSFL